LWYILLTFSKTLNTSGFCAFLKTSYNFGVGLSAGLHTALGFCHFCSFFKISFRGYLKIQLVPCTITKSFGDQALQCPLVEFCFELHDCSLSLYLLFRLFQGHIFFNVPIIIINLYFKLEINQIQTDARSLHKRFSK